MVIDTSAILAILQDQPERRAFNEAIEAEDSRVMSVATFVETSIVMETRTGAEGVRDFDLFIERAGIELIEVSRCYSRARTSAGPMSWWRRLDRRDSVARLVPATGGSLIDAHPCAPLMTRR